MHPTVGFRHTENNKRLAYLLNELSSSRELGCQVNPDEDRYVHDADKLDNVLDGDNKKSEMCVSSN